MMSMCIIQASVREMSKNRKWLAWLDDFANYKEGRVFGRLRRPQRQGVGSEENMNVFFTRTPTVYEPLKRFLPVPT